MFSCPPHSTLTFHSEAPAPALYLVVEACAMIFPPIGFLGSAANMAAPSTWATTWLVITTATPNWQGKDKCHSLWSDIPRTLLLPLHPPTKQWMTKVSISNWYLNTRLQNSGLLARLLEFIAPEIRHSLSLPQNLPHQQVAKASAETWPSASAWLKAHLDPNSPFCRGQWHCLQLAVRTYREHRFSEACF